MYNTQDDRVRKYLFDNKTIQPLQAWTELGVYRLAAVIHRLREVENIKIATNRVKVLNQFGETCKVAEYKLEE